MEINIELVKKILEDSTPYCTTYCGELDYFPECGECGYCIAKKFVEDIDNKKDW